MYERDQELQVTRLNKFSQRLVEVWQWIHVSPSYGETR